MGTLCCIITTAVPVKILPCSGQFLPYKGCGAHTGGGHVTVYAVVCHWVFPEGYFDSSRCHNYHIVDAPSVCFYEGKLSADGVCAAGARHYTRYSHGKCIMECAVHGIYCVYCPHAGRYGICAFICAVHLDGFLFFGYADMAVSVNKSRKHLAPCRIQYLHGFFPLYLRSYPFYFSVFQQYIRPDRMFLFHSI